MQIDANSIKKIMLIYKKYLSLLIFFMGVA